MIRMIVTDVDGTLIPEGMRDLPAGLPELIQALQDRGILFAAASGRSFHSLRTLFRPVAEKMLFFCEDGCAVFDGAGTLLEKNPIPPELVCHICNHTLTFPDANLVLGTPETAYICPCEGEFLHLMWEVKRYIVTPLRLENRLPEDVCKISVYCPNGSGDYLEEMERSWKPDCHVAVSGDNWVDFSVGDKADGLRTMLERLNISPEDVMYFGDNYNDVGAMELVGHPWLMRHAAPELRAKYPRQTDSVTEVLRAVLARLEGEMTGND